MLRKTLIMLLVLAISSSLRSELVYKSFYGVSPVAPTWVSKVENSETKFVLVFTPNLYFGNWSFTPVTKGEWIWGVLFNPAESTFYLQERLDSFASLILEFTNDGCGIFMEFNIEEPYTSKIRAISNNTNLPGPPYISSNSPKIAYFYLADKNKFLAVGRFPVKWGSSRYPVHVSGIIPVDNLTFSLAFSDAIYTFHAISSFPLLTPEEEYIQRNFSDQHTAGKFFADPSKFIFGHRLDFFFTFNNFAKMRVGFGELNVVGGKFPDLTDISPVGVYHNTYGEGYSNVTGGSDFELIFGKVFRIYGEIVFDDIIEPGETPESYKPAAQAFSLGSEVNFDRFKLWVEYSEASEWMYVTNYLPYLSISVRKFILQDRPWTRYLVDYPVGFLFGPDAKLLSFGFEWEFSNFPGSIALEYKRLVKGTVNDNGIVRWKWFWDRWPRNVSESGSFVPEKAGDMEYEIMTADVLLDFVRIFFETLDFKLFYGGVSVRLSL